MHHRFYGYWLALGAWAGLLLLALGQSAWAQDVERQIVVTGQGSVTVAPDMAVVTFGVTAQSSRAQSAMEDVAEDVRAIFAALVDLGVAPQDLQTTTLRLDPVFADRRNGGTAPGQGAPEIRGFVATNDIAVQVRELVQLGSILQAVLDEGANRLSSIRFTLADTEADSAEARRLAVQDALSRATLYADAAGVRVGPVVSIVEHGSGRPVAPMRAAQFDTAADIPVAAGELEITARVTMTFEIAN